MFLDNPWRHNLLKNVNIAKPFHRKICTTIFVTRFAHKLTLKWKKSLLLLFSVGGSSMPPQSVKIVSISRYQYHQWRCLNSKEYWEKYGNFYSPLSFYASYKKRKNDRQECTYLKLFHINVWTWTVMTPRLVLLDTAK